jgi:hypothetical protein
VPGNKADFAPLALLLPCASLQPSHLTTVATRFSMVVHPSGSPESLRDVRGFATKFYTQEGNWDLVGNSIPVSTQLLTTRRCRVLVRVNAATRENLAPRDAGASSGLQEFLHVASCN